MPVDRPPLAMTPRLASQIDQRTLNGEVTSVAGLESRSWLLTQQRSCARSGRQQPIAIRFPTALDACHFLESSLHISCLFGPSMGVQQLSQLTQVRRAHG